MKKNRGSFIGFNSPEGAYNTPPGVYDVNDVFQMEQDTHRRGLSLGPTYQGWPQDVGRSEEHTSELQSH